MEQGSYDSHKFIGKDIHAKECMHSRILFRWICGIPWRGRHMEESEIRISSFSKELGWDLSFLMDTSYCKEQPKKQEDDTKSKIIKEEKVGSGNSSTDSVLCVWTRLPKIYTAWMGPFV
jgi:hypothetical protein